MKQGPGNGNCGDGADVWEEDTWGLDNADSWSSSDASMGRKHEKFSIHCKTFFYDENKILQSVL